ncbi:MAG TPA: YkvA family protein [Burkholderiales bacterium]|nr:YkvA family protein [Burkholderiales bacterium]
MTVLASLKQRARELKAEVLALYLAARHPRTPWYAKAFLAAIVAYALSPIDLIPDFIPVLGFVDEIILLPFAIALAVKMIPADVMDECRARARREHPDATRAGRIGAALIVLLWLALIVLAGLWAHSTFGYDGKRELLTQENAHLQQSAMSQLDKGGAL